MRWTSLVFSLTLRGLIHPPTGIALVRTAWRFRRRRWWRRPPFLPVPSMPYVRWRMHTAYGDPHAVPSVRDVIHYARWAARK